MKVLDEGQIIMEWLFSDTFGNFEVQSEGNRKHLVRLTASGTSLYLKSFNNSEISHGPIRKETYSYSVFNANFPAVL